MNRVNLNIIDFNAKDSAGSGAVFGYLYNGRFYSDSAHTQELTPAEDTIYVDKTSNASYTWDGTEYVVMGASVNKQVDVADSVASQELAPNTLYVFATRSSNLALSLGTPQEGKANEYMFQITIDGTTLPTISGLPGTIVWNGGSAPAFALGKFYEVSILNGVGYFVEI